MKYLILFVLIAFIGCTKKSEVVIVNKNMNSSIKEECFDLNNIYIGNLDMNEIHKKFFECQKGKYREDSEELKKEIELNKPKVTIYDTRVEKIWINPMSIVFTKNPKICGKMTLGAGWRAIFVTIRKDKKVYGTYWAEPNIWDKTWCTIIIDDLQSGEYEAKAEIIKKDNTKLSISESFEVKIIE